MILTIDVPEDLAERLKNEAQAEGISPQDLAVEALADRFATAPVFDPDTVEAIRRGRADIEAGRTIGLEEFAARRLAERAQRAR